MRLSEIEKEALNNAITNVDGEVFLFGSRTNLSAKGGDIDILVLSEDNPYRTSQNITVKFQMICDEKIDVIVMNPLNMDKAEKAFLIQSLNYELNEKEL